MLTKIFFVSLILLLSRAQSEQDYYFHAGALEASTIGGVTSFLSQLVNVPELTVSNLSNETISSLAETYYGTDTFAPLLIRANNDYVWISASDIIPDNITLRLPSVVYCTQFVGIDCILDSYRKSQGSTAASNFWNNLPVSLQSQLSLYLSYPNYIYLTMSLLQDRLINPAPTLAVKLINLLNFDLINGAVSFTTGFGKAIASTIPSNQEIVYNANRSDLLQGIHGSVSYDLAFRNSTRSFAIDFHVYALNGTFHNSLYFAGQNTYTTTSAGVKDLSLGSGVNALISITPSPDAAMTVIFYQPTTNLNLTGVKKLVPYSKNTNAFGARWNTTGYYALGSALRNTYLWQGWRFIPVQSPPLQDNRFLIIHALTNLALQVTPAFGNVTLGTPDKKNVNQIWNVIPSAASATSYYIKGSQGLCLYTNPSFFTPYATNTSFLATWLEPCLRAAEESNLSWTIEAFTSYTFDP